MIHVATIYYCVNDSSYWFCMSQLELGLSHNAYAYVTKLKFRCSSYLSCFLLTGPIMGRHQSLARPGLADEDKAHRIDMGAVVWKQRLSARSCLHSVIQSMLLSIMSRPSRSLHSWVSQRRSLVTATCPESEFLGGQGYPCGGNFA